MIIDNHSISGIRKWFGLLLDYALYHIQPIFSISCLGYLQTDIN